MYATFASFDGKISPFSFAFSYLIILYLEVYIFLPIKTIKVITKERIDFNISTLNTKLPNYHKLIKIKILFVTLACLSLFVIDIKPYYAGVVKFFTPTKAFLTLDYQAFSDKKPLTYQLTTSPQKITIDSSSYVKISFTPAFKNDTWKLFLQDAITKQKEKFNYSFSGQLLAEKFFSHPIYLELENGRKTFLATLNVMPTPQPVVVLKQEPLKFKFFENTTQKLAFSVHVDSDINVTSLLLSLRTESGFHFEQTLVDNNNQKNFDLPYTEIMTTGIPFKEEDILYVKAIAKTPIINHDGISNELQFKVKSPTKLKKEIVKQLKVAQSQLLNAKNFDGGEKNKIQEPLLSAEMLAETIRPNSYIAKKIQQLIADVQNIANKDDEFYQKSEKQLTDLLKSLQWQIQQRNVQDLIYKIQLLNKTLSSAIPNYQESSDTAKQLADAASKTLEDLKSTAKELNSFLTKNEKKQLTQFFQNDTTEKKLIETAENLNKIKLNAAKNNAEDALNSAKKNIYGIMQILKHAHKNSLDKQTKEDEEKEEQDENQEEEMRNHRSYMDAIATQGFLDQSFRKNILDNITRLKKEGNPANTQMIEYLESQLR